MFQIHDTSHSSIPLTNTVYYTGYFINKSYKHAHTHTEKRERRKVLTWYSNTGHLHSAGHMVRGCVIFVGIASLFPCHQVTWGSLATQSKDTVVFWQHTDIWFPRSTNTLWFPGNTTALVSLQCRAKTLQFPGNTMIL